MAEMVQDGKDVLNCINNHERARTTFPKLSNSAHLVTFGDTRFGTVVYVWERLVQQKNAVQGTFTDKGYLVYAKKQEWWEASEELKERVLPNSFWKLPTTMVVGLEPIFMLLRLADGDTPCTGKVYHKMYTLVQTLLNMQGLSSARCKTISSLAAN
eukprot:gene12488-14754_t